jgi:predicted metal-binding transcription factor (methanogenesis marker protein 9)
MAKRGRPSKTKTEATIVNESEAPKKPRGKAATVKASTTGMSQAEVNKLKKEIKEEILNCREFARMKKEILIEAKKEVLRSVVNPLVSEFRKIDK